MTFRILSRSIGLTCLLLTLLVPVSQAQEWQQEVEIITPVRPGEPIHVFLDSLDDALKRTPGVRLRRSAEAPDTLSYDELLGTLLRDGMDLQSATHAFIRYRFTLDNQTSQLVESIESITFITRFDENYSDTPMLHINTQDPVIHQVLVERGIPSMMNMKSFTPFRQLMAFPILQEQEETAMVEMAGRALRDDFMAERATFLEFLEDRTGFGYSTYVLSTKYDRVVQAAAKDSTLPQFSEVFRPERIPSPPALNR